MHEVVLSFGMSTSEEIASAVKVADGLSPTLLQCTSEYPCLPERIGINAMRDLRRHGKPVGLSDHSGTIWPSIIAAYEDASMSEVHVCWSKECWGPDVPASITIDELRQLVQGVRFVERMGSVDKDKMASELSSMRSIFMGNIS
jgi:N-acetylneuraminate synthase